MIASRPFELAYQMLNRCRRELYRRGTLHSLRLPRPVISIGNLAVGGSGKTPAAITIARELIRRGYNVVILTRGYRGTIGRGWAIVSEHDPERFGDEPVLMAQSLPGTDVVVGADRHRAGSAYLETRDCDLFILDDGFQHLRLQRDVDVVLLDRSARWSREGDSALLDADLVLLRTDSARSADSEAIAAKLEPRDFHWQGMVHSLDRLRGMRVVAFSGLANNEQFFDSVRRLGATVVDAIPFPDHTRYGIDDLERVERSVQSNEAECAVTTQKDFVKIGDPEVGWIEAQMTIEPEEEFFSRLLEHLPLPARSPDRKDQQTSLAP
ncbi:MAG TPA: tetraacyldisaccharide 4'-kinase [Thermoanaerobaculia bacterium]|nr:tetraacyldisaccharide 4'-kinase [Thermoanaerobaculia bacterium]